MTQLPRLSALIVARNEEARLPDCLASCSFADETVVVLDRSTDLSAAIAREAGARVVEGGWELEGERRNSGLDACNGDWILEVDADERVSPQLAAAIRRTIAQSPHAWHQVRVDNYVGERLVRYGWAGSFGTTSVPRLSRKGAKRWRAQRVHPGLDWTGKEGPRIEEGALVHLVDRDISDMLRRLDKYSSARAGDLIASGDIGSVASNLRRFAGRAIKSYVSRKGYREGAMGVLLAFCTAAFPLLSYLKARLEPEKHGAAGRERLPAIAVAAGRPDAGGGAGPRGGAVPCDGSGRHRRAAALGRRPLAHPWRPALATSLARALQRGALCAWGIASALWSIEPARGAETALALGALVLLGAGAARALEEDATDHLRRLGPCLAVGLAIGIVLLGFDHASQNLFRRAVRGFPGWTMQLGFGLKPAVSVLAILLPLVLAAPGVPRAMRAAILVPGVAVALWLPGESAKIAATVGVLAGVIAIWLPRAVARVSAGALAVVFVAAPLLFSAGLARVMDLSPLPFSAAHRVLIWDFALQRIEQKPILGWGMEASRSIPGGTDRFDRATLDRYGLDSTGERAAFAAPSAQRLPLHTHNAALQVWLELGFVGAVLAAALVATVLLAAGGSVAPPAALGAAVAGAVTGQLSFGVWQPWWIATMVFVWVAARGLLSSRSG